MNSVEERDLERPLLEEQLDPDLVLDYVDPIQPASRDSVIPFEGNHQEKTPQRVLTTTRMRRATRFLSDPRLSGTNSSQQLRFLQQKGYTKQEIAEAQVLSERVVKAKRLLEHPRLQYAPLKQRISYIRSKYCTSEEVEEAVRLLDKASFLQVKNQKGEAKKSAWSSVFRKLLPSTEGKNISIAEKIESLEKPSFLGQTALIISGSFWKKKNIIYMASSLVTLSSFVGLMVFLVMGNAGGSPTSITPSADVPQVEGDYSYGYYTDD